MGIEEVDERLATGWHVEPPLMGLEVGEFCPGFSSTCSPKAPGDNPPEG